MQRTEGTRSIWRQVIKTERMDSHRLRCAIVFLASSIIASSSYAQQQTIEAKIQDVMRVENIGALAFGIVDKQKTLTQKTYGHYSTDKLRAIDLDSIFRIGSISKTFTALSALLLEQRSAFQLSTPVREYLNPPPYNNLWSDTDPITTAMLIEHTAGFKDLSKEEFDQTEPMSLADAFKIAPNSRTTVWRPGLHSSYSNSGAGITSAVIESVSGLSFIQFVDKHVFTPLKLHSATFNPPEDAERLLVRGYDSDGKTPIPYWHQIYPAFGSLNASTRDMLKFTRILLNDGEFDGQQLIPRELVFRMTAVTTGLAAKHGLSYGYGKGLYAFQRKGVGFHGHGGDADGYLAFLAFSRELERGYYIVFNSYNPAAMRALRKIIENHLTKNTQPNPPQRYIMTDAERNAVTGDYAPVTHRFGDSPSENSMEVFTNAENDLFTRINNGKARLLIPVAKGKFRRREHSIATIALVDYASMTFLQGDFGNFQKQR